MIKGNIHLLKLAIVAINEGNASDQKLLNIKCYLRTFDLTQHVVTASAEGNLTHFIPLQFSTNDFYGLKYRKI